MKSSIQKHLQTMCRATLLLICVATHSCLGNSSSILSTEQRSAGSRIITSTVAGRDLTIYLPSGYDSAQKQVSTRLPVLYCYDGQSVFGEMHIADVLDEYIAAKRVEPMIVVGIHSGAARISETVPYNDAWISGNWGAYTPNARGFAELLKSRIIPSIDAEYYTDKRSERRTIMGFSLGGLFAAWSGLHFRDTFGAAISLSPSFWVADEQFFTEAQASHNAPRSFYFDVGATTGEWNYYVPLIKIFKEKNMRYGDNLLYYEDPQGRHNAASWQSRVPNVLLFADKVMRQKPHQNSHQDSLVSLRAETEVIQSASTPGRFFLRLNPIITTQKGLQYSLATEAVYALLNPNDGALASDGRFQFTGTNDLRVNITYKQFSTHVIISYTDIQRRMGK
jgi:enterochelin esterase-like enzyme